MKWKVYSEYKEKTKPWLSEIPVHWDTRRIKHTTYVKGRIGWQGLRSEEFIDRGPFLVTGTDFIDGTINWASCYHITEERYSEDPYIQLKNGDLLITKDGTIGKVAIVQELEEKATLNSGIFLTRQITNHCEPRFMYWLLNSSVFTNFIDFNKSGSTISHLFQNIFVEFLYPIPSIEEQQTIAAFLDRETDHIDTLIAKKQRQIELLQEKRSAVKSGDVLVSCVGTYGKVAVVPKNIKPGIINPRLIKIEPKISIIIPDYLGLLLQSNICFEQMVEASRGGTMDIINVGILSQLQLPIPSLIEQSDILSFINTECSKIEKLLNHVELSLARLQEYRTAIISAAVTGKIDVRQEVA